MLKSTLLTFIAFAMISTLSVAMAQEPLLERPYMKAYQVQGSYDEIFEFIKVAVADRGIKINNISHIGKMLDRTAEAVGASKAVYTQAKAVEFCSATVSRNMMEEDPHHIVFCPYIIYVYELKQQPGTVYVGYRKPDVSFAGKESKALAGVEKLLEDIIADAIQ